MDEKLRRELDSILINIYKHTGLYECEDDAASEIEQAFRDAGYRKLPSEDELALWLCDHLAYTSRGLAQVLLERLLSL